MSNHMIPYKKFMDDFSVAFKKNMETPDVKAQPAKYFATPPYRAELFSEKTGWAGVMNAQGLNVLTFPDKPGAVVTDYKTAQSIADEWNKEHVTPANDVNHP